MKRFLVTGGAGFIGSHIVEGLLQRGHSVRVLDNFSNGKIKNIKPFLERIEVLRGDIRSLPDCKKASKGMDSVLHQAALRSVPKSLLNPHDYNEVNIQGTLNMLEASLANKVKSFVFASSSSVYGDVRNFPEKEDFLPQPISPYALTKLSGEYYCRMFSLYYGLPTVSLRYFNVFGPRQSPDDEYAAVIPKFITLMLAGRRPPIFGTGRQSRDFTYVRNVADANIAASSRPALKGEVFNIAGGANFSIIELVRILNKILNTALQPRFLDRRRGDVFKTRADLSRAKGLLGFTPRINFREGLRLTAEYFRHG
ncbi:MAG: NAD-dependent epimerase/dehydratase family protein [Candidatus Omnitrophota bacterium]